MGEDDVGCEERRQDETLVWENREHTQGQLDSEHSAAEQ